MTERPTRREADHDARLDAADLADATGSATFLAWCDRLAAQATGDLVADYPHEDGLF